MKNFALVIVTVVLICSIPKILDTLDPYQTVYITKNVVKFGLIGIIISLILFMDIGEYE